MTDSAHFLTLATAYPEAVQTDRRKRAAWVAGLVLLATYLAYVWVAFDVPAALARANWPRASMLALDSYAYKHHVELSTKSGRLLVTLEGDRRNALKKMPDWVVRDGAETHVRMGRHLTADMTTKSLVLKRDGSLIANIRIDADGPVLLSPPQDWMKVASNKIEGWPSRYNRIIVTKNKIMLHVYSLGWENFWFDARSPLHGTSIWNAIKLVVSGPQIDPTQSNLSLVTSEIWNNSEWQHGQIFYAMLITVLMAFCGTALAAMTALPLSFLAANNITPIALLRGVTKRSFDFLRGVDALIWSLVFIRAMGLGPLSGILAIWFTDTGTFGKMFSEAIENSDKKQVEGIRSAGGGLIQSTWFGVVPQILPVLVAQVLYFLESNTRSATVIGMLGAGGIGLKLADTMRTGQDWENTMYIIFLIIIVVIVMDNLSVWLRSRLIKGSEKSAL